MSKTHAEILAEIARQVVAEHRNIATPEQEPATEPATNLDESWSYTLPDRYRA